MDHRVRQHAAGLRIGVGRQVGGAAFGDQLATALAGAGADVDQVVGAADRILVVFDDDQRIALVAERLQRIQQHLVVARMQADRRLVEHVADALQVAAELRGKADALRFAAAQRRRRAVERQIAEADLFQEFEPALDLGDDIARDFGLAAGELQRRDPAPRFARPTIAQPRRSNGRRR